MPTGGPAPASATLAAVVGSLRCPTCGAGLMAVERVLRCPGGHSHDVARQGYVTLLPARRRLPLADSAAMVAARDAFLRAGHYAPIAEAVAAAGRAAVDVPIRRSGCVVDLGAGPGHYLAAMLEALAGWRGLALDASRPAIRRALRAHPRIAAVACDVWQPLPLADAAADLALNVFAPRDGGEIARILRPHGALVVVTPAPDHLRELRTTVGMLGVDAGKRTRLHARLSPHLESVVQRGVDFDMALAHADVQALMAMGPSAHHVTPEQVSERLRRIPEPVRVTGSVSVETFRRV
jgi:23S rRNA (guanine745-N1)-methyltransferase